MDYKCITNLDFNKVRNICMNNSFLFTATDGNKFRCIFSTRVGDNDITLYPLPTNKKKHQGKQSVLSCLEQI